MHIASGPADGPFPGAIPLICGGGHTLAWAHYRKRYADPRIVCHAQYRSRVVRHTTSIGAIPLIWAVRPISLRRNTANSAGAPRYWRRFRYTPAGPDLSAAVMAR